MSKIIAWFIFLAIVSAFFTVTTTDLAEAQTGASLFLSPASGTFTVGSTFTVSVILNTNNQFINAVQADLSFPPDKLQVVSPSLGTSVISVWTDQPQFDNQKGILSFQGGVPDPGIKISRGVISTLTFRVKSVGRAVIKFLDTSKVLLNDGLATDVLTNTSSGIYDLVLPPPAGPLIVSETHPDQSVWYKNSTASLRWITNFPVEGYSYVLNSEPIDVPDNISEGAKTQVVYKDVPDGIHFFHVKALRSGVWGESSHFAIKIDASPPAEFSIDISPSRRTSNRRPLINFFTTDALSGIDHYELKIVPRNLKESPAETAIAQPFFIEASSPYSTELSLGRYDAIVRVYDQAGNFREVSQKLSIVTPIFKILITDILPPWVSVLIGLIILAAVLYATYFVWQWHRRVHLKHLVGALKDPDLAAKLRQLQEKQSQYLKHLVILLMLSLGFFGAVKDGNAQMTVLSPPIVTTISKDVSNEEIFYVGGKAVVPGSSVIIYIQSLHDGETFSETVISDKKGDWFYTYPKFLSAGRYLVWAQIKLGQELSAPSPQFEINVAQTALQLGVSRLSFETLYLIFIILLLVGLTSAISFMIYHGYHGRRKHKSLLKEIREAEEAIKRGFMVLRRDIQAELAVINKHKLNNQISPEDLEKENRLLQDLEWVNKMLEKEIKDAERLAEEQ